MQWAALLFPTKVVYLDCWRKCSNFPILLLVCRWKDISNVINHKKAFKIECQSELEDAKQFMFTDSRSAKYMWRLCIAQHTFYMQHQEARPSERLTSYFVSRCAFNASRTEFINVDFRTGRKLTNCHQTIWKKLLSLRTQRNNGSVVANGRQRVYSYVKS